jgi:serine/threonine protein kinase
LSIEYFEGGELFDYIVSNHEISERMARKIFRQILSALDYCHSSCVIHRGISLTLVFYLNTKEITW